MIPVMAEPTQPTPEAKGVRLSVTVDADLYARLSTVKGKTRKPITDLCAQWIAEGVERAEAELAKA